MLDSKKYRDAQKEAATTDAQKECSTLQISNQSTMAIISHYLELIRDYILRMKHFTNLGIEDSLHKGRYLDSEPDNTVESNGSGSSSSFSEDSPKKAVEALKEESKVESKIEEVKLFEKN